MSTFSDLHLHPNILSGLKQAGYQSPTPIQSKAIPLLLKGKDVLGCAQTGTGKTAAFLLPILHKLQSQPVNKGIQALVVSPTRELAAQIGENFEVYAKDVDHRTTVIFGGVKQDPQVKKLKRGVDVLVATPGRLLDLHGQGFIDLSKVSFFVLDEADRMLDMGFLPDIKRIVKLLPSERQNLLFSATMPANIAKLVQSMLKDPVRVEVDRESSTVDKIEQRVMYVEQPNKKHLLKHLLDSEEVSAAIVFSRTKHGANRIATFLEKKGISAASIHGNKSQNARTRALDGFKAGEIRVLVATDVASRGIDVDLVSHVFNFDLPNVSEDYVHRIGRTGRAGATGQAVAFCSPDEAEYLLDIEKIIAMQIPDNREQPWHCYPALEKVLIKRVEREEASEKRAKSSKGKGKRSGNRKNWRRKGGRKNQ